MKKRHWNLCNVVSAPSGQRTVWKFSPESKGARLSAEKRLQDGEKPPSDWVNKGLSTLFGQEKVNIAWLRSEQIFLRTIRIPAAELKELHSMIDLQLEKLSPLAVGQMAWTFELLGQPIDGLQNVLVVIVDKRQVDGVLNGLQGNGFMADKLEIPCVRQLSATRFDRDGAWAFLGVDGSPSRCLIAWHFQGVVQAVNLIHIGAGDERDQRLFEQLNQTLWTGEVEGWIQAPPEWTLVGTESMAAFWQPKFASWSGRPTRIEAALQDGDLAALSARHAADLPPEMTLVPPEFALRYKQALIDRTWMNALFAVLLAYVAVVSVYLGVLEFHRYEFRKADNAAKDLERHEAVYQEVLAQEQVLLKAADLRKAAIRTLRTASDNLPTDLTLTKLTLQGGKSLTLFGSAPSDQQKAVTDYADALAKATDEQGNKVFSVVNLPNSQNRPGAAGISWSFSCELGGSSLKEGRP